MSENYKPFVSIVSKGIFVGCKELYLVIYFFPLIFQSNPFRQRICHVFSTSEEKDDSLSFEDFLDLLSAFSDSATPEIKSHYAFRIFGTRP